MKKILYVLPVIGLMFLSACASTEEPVNDEDKSAETLYNEAYDYLNKTSYQKAAETFDKVEMEHPYSKWATKSKLMCAYSYYKDEKYDDAIAALDRYIRPRHPRGSPATMYRSRFLRTALSVPANFSSTRKVF